VLYKFVFVGLFVLYTAQQTAVHVRCKHRYTVASVIQQHHAFVTWTKINQSKRLSIIAQ